MTIQIWKIAVGIVVLVMLVFTTRTMNALKALSNQTDAQAKQQLAQKKKQLRWQIRLLVVVFVVVLIVTFVEIYLPLFHA